MQQDLPLPIRTLPVLLGALILGILAFTGVAAYLAATGSPTTATTGNTGIPEHLLLIILVVLGMSEFGAYHAVIRPALAKKGRDTVATVQPESARDLALGQQFAVKTILAAALLEGWGLFGTVIVMLHAQWVAIAAPIIAAAGLALMLNVRDRYARFREDAVGQRVV